MIKLNERIWFLSKLDFEVVLKLAFVYTKSVKILKKIKEMVLYKAFVVFFFDAKSK